MTSQIKQSSDVEEDGSRYDGLIRGTGAEMEGEINLDDDAINLLLPWRPWRGRASIDFALISLISRVCVNISWVLSLENGIGFFVCTD